jgi:hypothetical protein
MYPLRTGSTASAVASYYYVPRDMRPSVRYERAVAAMRVALGEEGFAAAWTEGQAMPLEEAIAEALRDPQPAGGP